jgi:hypothetical protein
MDRNFAQLACTNLTFLNEWKRVPYLWCEEPLSAHCLAGRTDSYDPSLISEIIKARPFGIKLSNHTQYHPQTNQWLLLEESQKSLENIDIPKIQWMIPPSYDNANFFDQTYI